MNSSSGTPSWAATQRQTGQYRPQTSDSFDPRQQQSSGAGGMNSSASLGRFPSRGQDQQQQWPSSTGGSDAQSSQSHRASSYQPMQQQQQQQQKMGSQQDSDRHRRTQSLRPFSAFQPLDQADPYSPRQGGPASDRPPSPTGSTSRSIRTSAAPLTFKSPELRSALFLQDAQQKKTYMEGYLSRRDALGADGKPLHPNDPKK